MKPLVLFAVWVASAAAAHVALSRRGPKPSYHVDAATTKYCVDWYDYDFQEISCSDLRDAFDVTLQEWSRWNPSAARCDSDGLEPGLSYCVAVENEPNVPTATATATSAKTSSRPASSSVKPSTTPAPAPTATTPSNGITTPLPIQPNMIDNCDKFYKVVKGDKCSVISQKNGISVDEIVEWNPSVGKTCQSLWLDYHVCVSIVGHEPTPTRPTNGVPTPTAVQPEMAAMCSKFHFVLEGESCSQVAQKNGISTVDLKLWNGKVGASCEGLRPKMYACVGIIPAYDFGGGHLAGWDTHGTDVSAASKALVVPDSRGYNAVLDALFSDVVMEADVALSHDRGNAGLMFRVAGRTPGTPDFLGYYAFIEAGGFVVLGVDNHGWRETARARVPVEVGRSHRLRVMATGERIHVYVDDMAKPKLEATDSTFKTGRVGVRVWETGATFDNVDVRSVVYEGFTQNLVGWTIADGGWDASSGVLVANEVHSGTAVFDTIFADVMLDALIKLPTRAEGNAGFLFRATDFVKGGDQFRGYYAGISAHGFVVVGYEDRGWRELGKERMAINSGHVYNVRIRAVGESIEVFVDDMDRPKLSVRDSKFKKGMCGARVYRTSAHFDDISLWNL